MSMSHSKSNSPNKPRLSSFAQKLLVEWRRLNLAEDATVIVAVSGGADSTALLLALQELLAASRLHVTLVVAHLNHGLRPASRKDARSVAELAEKLGFHFVSKRVNLAKARPAENLEQAARKARYEFLLRTAQKQKSGYVLSGHTLDDQAETILMRLLRGSAAEGLSGMRTSRSLAAGTNVLLVRPLLAWARRAATESYCRSRGVEFLTDEMNNDETFSRVRVRKQLLPLMRSFNNRIVETLSRTGDLLNEDAAALAAEATQLLAQARSDSLQNNETELPSLSVNVLLQKPAAIRRRALRDWISQVRGNLNRLEMVHLIAVENLLNDGRGGRFIELPGGMTVTRRRGNLELSGKKGLKKR
jgi:tRNA(Ile)-lysidine synthase